MQAGHLELPELRRVTPDGYGALVPLSEATDDELSDYALALLVFRRDVNDRIIAAVDQLNRERGARENAREIGRVVA